MNYCGNDQRSALECALIFSGTAHPELAEEIAEYLGKKVEPSIVRKFSNDNFYVHLGTSVRGKDVFVIQPLSPPCSDNLLELLFMLDVARGAGAKSIHAVIPYYSYARSDKKDAPRISIAGRLIADLLATAGATHVITMTLHSPQVHGFFSVPADHLSAQSVLVKYLKQRDLSNTVVVAPDIGHAKRAAKLARSLKLPIAAGEKMRLGDAQVTIQGVIGDVRGKRVVMIDDEIATGGTMVQMIYHLRDNYEVHDVTVIGTHGLFTGDAVERLDSVAEINEIIVTNTVPQKGKCPKRLTVLSVASIFGEVIRRNLLGQSVGALFEFWRQPEID